MDTLQKRVQKIKNIGHVPGPSRCPDRHGADLNTGDRELTANKKCLISIDRSRSDARNFCRAFFDWYNHHHRHSGIAMLTPASVHYGASEPILQRRAVIMIAAYARNPERFVKCVPKIQTVPKEVWINKPISTPETVS
jgi:Integrase core domain